MYMISSPVRRVHQSGSSKPFRGKLLGVVMTQQGGYSRTTGTIGRERAYDAHNCDLSEEQVYKLLERMVP